MSGVLIRVWTTSRRNERVRNGNQPGFKHREKVSVREGVFIRE